MDNNEDNIVNIYELSKYNVKIWFPFASYLLRMSILRLLRFLGLKSEGTSFVEKPKSNIVKID